MAYDEFFDDESFETFGQILEAVMDRAADSLGSGGVASLLLASAAIADSLALPEVLHRITASAVELIGAEHGTLGVVDGLGRVAESARVGMTGAEATAVDAALRRAGIVQTMLDDPHPIRLDRFAESPIDAVGGNIPFISSVLAVPVRARGINYGHLIITNALAGEFSADDTRLASALAAAAAFAIDSARMSGEAAKRRAWSAASAEIFAALLVGESNDPLRLLASKVRELCRADAVCVLRTTSDRAQTTVAAALGLEGLLAEGDRVPIEGTAVSGALEARQPRTAHEIDVRECGSAGILRLGPTAIVPLLSAERTLGALLIARRPGEDTMSVEELEMVADFAGHASVAMQLADTRADLHRVLLIEDRARIARDLHDHVIQQLFATGLQLRSVAAPMPPGATADRIGAAVASVDAAIGQIRTAILALPSAHDAHRASVRHRILDLIGQLAPQFAHTPKIVFSGPVDLVITDDLEDDVVAVARESLTNVARHAQAATASMSLSVDDNDVTVIVLDDGIGIPPQVGGVQTRSSGLANLRDRALKRGGAFTAESAGGGTRVVWTAPYLSAGDP